MACGSYVDHIKELPSLLDIPDELPSVPMIFLKSPSSIVRCDPHIHLPSWSADVQHEVWQHGMHRTSDWNV
eukprot:364069-Chlamydomonas_euryale.AAC.5